MIMVDVSGSMNTALEVKNQQDFVQQSESDDATAQPTYTAQDGKPPAPVQFTRATAARMGVKKFVDARNGDRVALLLFDNQVYDACTFTRDMKIMDKKLPLIDQYQGGGTNFDGPDNDNPYSKVGAIQGAINYFKQSGQSKTKVLIMVTDGEDSINAKRFTELGAQLQEMGIHMYVLGVGESWVNGTVDFIASLTRSTERFSSSVTLKPCATVLQRSTSSRNRRLWLSVPRTSSRFISTSCSLRWALRCSTNSPP